QERVIFNLSASFQAESEGLEHQHEMPTVPAPETLQNDVEARRAFLEPEPISENFKAALLRPQPIEMRPVRPDHPLRPENREPLRQTWLRVPGPLPDDQALHRMLLAYASDHSLFGVALQ